ncbi:MAG: HK97 gp10 family phage protein [Oscillospiraceae bacterium]|nr:HK97 gp10 family phage protein [Oscillospiraceae bacterium]
MSAGAAGGDVLSFDTKGVEVMIKALNRVGESPQKAVNKATSKAILIVKRAARINAPKGKTRTLQKSIVVRAEKNHGVKGKKVRQVTFNSEANAQLQRPIREPGKLGGQNPKAYYPASQEYGFLARAPGGGVQYIPGKYYMRSAAEQTGAEAKGLMIEIMETELEKLWQEASHS